MEYPKRKRIRLPNYDYSKKGYYYVTICTYTRQKIFKMSTFDDDLCIIPSQHPQNQIIEKWLFELQNKFGIKIDKYIIMPDHIHIILIINTEPHTGHSLPDMMQWFKTMTTNEYIRMVGKKVLKPFETKLWQKSYYDHIIRDEEDYLTKAQYIINNPIKEENNDYYIKN